jgi:hypothetical protein
LRRVDLEEVVVRLGLDLDQVRHLDDLGVAAKVRTVFRSS